MIKFKTQLISIGLIGLLGSLVIGVCSWYAQSINHAVLTTSQLLRQAQQNHMESDMMHDALRGDVLEAFYVANQRQDLATVMANLQAHTRHFQAQLTANKQLALSIDIKQALSDLDRPLQTYIESANTLVTTSATDVVSAQLQYANFQQAFTTLETNMASVSELLHNAEREAVLASQQQVSFANNLVIAAVLVFGSAACAMALRIARRVMRQLGAEPSQVAVIANRIGSGDYQTDTAQVCDAQSVLGQLERTRQTLLNNQLKEQENELFKQQQYEVLQNISEENLRIRQALDGSSVKVMIADNSRTIIYANASVLAMLRHAESELRKALPHFSVDRLVGSNMDIFHQMPAHQATLLSHLTSTFTTNIVIAGRYFRLIANPIFNDHNERLGSVVEWQDRTLEVIAENEVAAVVQATSRGDFSQKVTEANKAGFMLAIAKGLNQLTETAEVALSEIANSLQRIAAGDLHARVVSNYGGTFKTLKDSCNESAEKLSRMLLTIRDSAQTINLASSEIAKGNTDLSSRTEEQASSLEETASSMEELTGTVRQNADNARQANQLAARAAEIATNGGTLINQVVVTMASIHESSRKIADIISVIDGIAFQTNILALNAAVEAARAGEQGRGFAVVAGEVRTLAQRSANAAKDIKDLISDSVTKISNGNNLVGRSGETMQDIVVAIKRVNDIMAEIAAASAEQAAGLDEVGKAVSQMDEMTQQNAALVEQAAAASESLLIQSDALSDAVAMFNIEAQSQRLPAAQKTLGSQKTVTRLNKTTDDEWESF